MKWRGMIYQNVTFSPSGASAGGDHMDHIHIDWHNGANVTWKTGITKIPLQLKRGAVIQMPLVQGSQIASSIAWTAEAETALSSASALISDISDLMARSGRGELKKIPWSAGVLASAQNSMLNTVRQQLPGTWHVAIVGWKGLFVFDAAGNASWRESERSAAHPGSWTVNGQRLEWKFRDVGDFRTFTAPLPLSGPSVAGTILPAGQGWFSMSKRGAAVA